MRLPTWPPLTPWKWGEILGEGYLLLLGSDEAQAPTRSPLTVPRGEVGEATCYLCYKTNIEVWLSPLSLLVEAESGFSSSIAGVGHLMSEDFCLAKVALSQAFHGDSFYLCLFGISRLQASPDPSKKKTC